MAMYRQAARREWDQARRKAFWADVRARLKGAADQLLSFQALSQRVQLGNFASAYLGQAAGLDQADNKKIARA